MIKVQSLISLHSMIAMLLHEDVYISYQNVHTSLLLSVHVIDLVMAT